MADVNDPPPRNHDHPPRRPPIGFAHRGGRAGLRFGRLRIGPSGEFAENTVPAFQNALRLGAAAVESDVWLTSDGEPVLRHDGDVGERRVRDLPLAELPPGTLTLADLYDACGTDFDLSLDMSDPGALEAVVTAATKSGTADRIWLVSEWPIGRDWRAAAGGEVHLVAGVSARHLGAGFLRLLADVRTAGSCAINMPDWQWNRARARATHAAGLLGFGWRANTPWQIRRLADAGCDGIYSDAVRALIAVTR
ncbi:MAG: glycerophosphodiester phosphodiesterase [Mycobacteriales bacterium]